MTTSETRWLVTAGWTVAMALVWAMFVPDHLSSIVFALVAAVGLLLALCGTALLNDSQAPRPVSAIIADLEAGGRARGAHPGPMSGAPGGQP